MHSFDIRLPKLDFDMGPNIHKDITDKMMGLLFEVIHIWIFRASL